MVVEETNDLKQIFFDEYEGFADKRFKNIDSSSLFIIDDRTRKDENAKKQLFGTFCQMLAEIVDRHTVKIILRGEVPTSPDVAKWFEGHGATQARGDA